MNGYRVTCTTCRKEKIIPMTSEQYIRLDYGLSQGIHIQDVVPDLAPEWREMFISGMCPDCWNEFIEATKEPDAEERV